MSAVEAIDHSLRRAFANCFILLFSEVVGFLAKNNLFLTKQTGPFKKKMLIHIEDYQYKTFCLHP